MKKMKLYGLAGVVALAAIGGTFAYYNATDTFVNQFDTTNYQTSSTEQFDPGKGRDWKPGAEVDKKVYATNTGEGNVWVRIKFAEEWSNLTGDTTTKSFDSVTNEYTAFFPQSADAAGNNQASKIDGKVAADTGSVVYKLFAENAITDDGATAKGTQAWYFKDGYFYYCKPLVQNESTIDLLEKVKLAGETDMGQMAVSPGYFKVDKDKLTDDEKKALKPDLTFDANGNLNVPSGWYPLLADGSVPTGKVTTTTGYYYTPVDITGVDLTGLTGDALTAKLDELAKTKAVTVEEGQTVYTHQAKVLNEKAKGYADANYNLDITVEFVQADEEAAKNFVGAAWTWNPEKGTTIVKESTTPVTP